MKTDQDHISKHANELITKARGAYLLNQTDAPELIDNAICFAEQNDLKEALVRSLIIQAQYLNAVEQNESRYDIYERLHTLLRENVFDEKISSQLLFEVYFEQGNDAFIRSDFQNARKYYLKAILYSQQINNLYLLAGLHKNLADTLEEMGDIEGTIFHMKKAIQIFPKEELVHTNSINSPDLYHKKYAYAHILAALAQTCLDAGDYESALSYLEESQTVGSESPRYLMVYYQTLSQIYFAKQDFVNALEASVQSNRYSDLEYQNVNRSVFQINLKLNYARILIRCNRVLDAVYVLEQLLKTSTDTSPDRCQITIQLAIAHAMIANLYPTLPDDHNAAARIYLDDAEKLIPSVNVFHLPNALRELAEAKYLLGDCNSAYETLQLSNMKKENLYFAKVRNEIGSVRVLLKLEREEHEKELEAMKRKQLESELSNSTLQLIAQTELLDELRTSLSNIIRKLPAGDNIAKELREKLRNLPCKSVDWDRFDTQFKAAHPEFTQKLTTAYPTLTPTELRICTLVRMNLRSDEIARLFCLSERTIESHRYKIRKKMDLAEGADLLKELIQL